MSQAVLEAPIEDSTIAPELANAGKLAKLKKTLLIWGGAAVLVLLLVLGVLSFRKGHWVLGLIGFIFPLLWLVGAILPSRHAHR